MKLHWVAFILVPVFSVSIAGLETETTWTYLPEYVALFGGVYINGAGIAGVLTLILKWKRPNSVPRFGQLFAWSAVALIASIELLAVLLFLTTYF